MTEVIINTIIIIISKSYLVRLKVKRTNPYQNQPTGLRHMGTLLPSLWDGAWIPKNEMNQVEFGCPNKLLAKFLMP